MPNSYASIEIGGKISKAIAENLIQVINKQRISKNHGYPGIFIESVPDLIKRFSYNSVIYLSDDKAKNGAFEELEQFLVTSNIPFTRESESYLECDTKAVEFRPNMEKPICFSCLENGKPVIAFETVLRILNEIFAASNSPEFVRKIVKENKKYYALEGFPPLPPFEIEG